MAERYTTENLPQDADERVAAFCSPKPLGWVHKDYAFWVWSDNDQNWTSRYKFRTNLNAWPEVYKALEERKLEKAYVIQLWGVFDNHHIELVWSDWQCMNASAAERTAALLNMLEAQRG